jgi:Predicted phosphatases
MMRIRLVAFDFDGTLADSAPWFIAELGGLADRHGFRRVDGAELEALRRVPNREIIARLGVSRWRLPFIARDMRRAAARAAGSIPLFDGVPGMLLGLREHGLKLAIVSSNGEETIRRVLGPDAGLIDHYLTGIGLFSKAGRLKKLARQAGVAAAEILAVGDEVRDIEAARDAGAVAAAVTWGYAHASALAAARPDLTFTSIAEIVPAVVELAGERASQAV